MSEIISNRSELLFLYDIENANPNGDPLNENRPRFDTESSTILVSDVRLKRTIRDYWYEYKGFNGQGDSQDIFVRETTYNEGDKEYIKDGKRRAKDFQEQAAIILGKCIDIRVFGGVIPLSNDSITYIGPVQFQMGKSLNKTEIVEEQGTGAFASGDKKGQATFRTEYKIPYAVIGFNGVINEKSAQYSTMNEDDKALLIEGIWEGTKNLISRSKFGQAPLFLLTIDYNEPFYIGNLRQRLKLDCGEKNEMQIRSTNDFKLDISELIEVLKANKDKIAALSLKTDSRLTMVNNGQIITNISKNEL
ncbi:MAG TPA: type I-B CRISPR-associated protein Cas7/Csh2 [Prolixibacteraceae bacterium]|nr:type I-B CRISPR-associated protein Cas7/Csh2 [Prolixibacteraceae bacterium]